ncbi:PAS domain-containing protein [Methylobacterium sp. NEAU 140]|uniref:PAS domain-containing protein n=1 Tax=Methylobacterium sp. NEAU 140 TaxID=3064945 RepID=UPI002733C963|nr:PAS domain-containing protein [Methylobacterium sp. NEAU 140]MDP4025737.1 PAS domain-containing protein [Methylobacterium sp. NEAU 140]
MTIEPTPSIRPYVPAALAASKVGTWEYDIPADRFHMDAIMAPLYGLTLEEGELGVPISRIRTAIHPEDLPRHLARCAEMFRHGGLFIMEYRTRPWPGTEHWLMLRGSYEANARGQVVIGRGIAIDMTESRQDGYAEGQAHFMSPSLREGLGNPLDQLAEHALQARSATDRVGGRVGALLRPLVDALLYGIGRQLAARFDGPEDVQDEPERKSGRPH